MTTSKLELINDVDTLNMIERQKRDCLCNVGSKRHVKANNKYMTDHNPKEDSNDLMYWGVNNEYGWAMSQHLPCKMLRWEHSTTLENILETPDDNRKGYIVEVYLECPRDLHDKFKEIPPCPETLTPKMEWFSEFQQEARRK